MKKFDLNVRNIADLYVSGIPEYIIAKRFKVDRGTIRKRLIEARVPIRDCKAACILRMNNMTADEKKRITKNAHDAVRGVKRPDKECLEKAITRQKTLQYVGAGEKEILSWLECKGEKCVPQLAVHRYNIDIGCAPVAVEISVNWCNPLFQPHNRKKIMYLCNHGWAVIFVLVPEKRFICEPQADYIHAFIQSVRRNPSLIGEYRVIGREAKVKAIMRFDGENLPGIPSLK